MDKALHLPYLGRIIPEDVIEQIFYWVSDDDPFIRVSYTLRFKNRPAAWDLDIEDDDDVAAVTAWLEARS